MCVFIANSLSATGGLPLIAGLSSSGRVNSRQCGTPAEGEVGREPSNVKSIEIVPPCQP